MVRNAANLSFIRTCNRGFEAARGEYVVFLNNDTQVKARWLDELYETLSRDDKIGIAGSKLLYPDGRLQECGGIIWRMGDGWNWGRDQNPEDPRFCYMRDSDYVSGAALMIKSSLFKQLGKFDEYYVPLYYEDTDLCFKVRKLGYRTVVQPASEVIHFEGASAGTSVTGAGVKRFQAVNHRKFFDRWKDTLAAHRFNGEMPELEAERSVRQRLPSSLPAAGAPSRARERPGAAPEGRADAAARTRRDVLRRLRDRAFGGRGGAARQAGARHQRAGHPMDRRAARHRQNRRGAP